MPKQLTISSTEQFTQFLLGALTNEVVQEKVTSLLGDKILDTGRLSEAEEVNRKLNLRVSELEWAIDDLE